jgi:prepilin-type N-terminal cleavage/methylation domain-containing protein
MQLPKLLKVRASVEDGMTLIELTIVLLLMSIVLAIAGTTVFSLSQTASRNDTIVTDEQAASTVLAQVSRDIRSAHQVTFAGISSPTPTRQIELQMNQPASTWVEWVYTPSATTVNGVPQAANTLARYISNSATGPFKLSNPTVTTPVNIVNGSTAYVFRYFQGNGSEITLISSPSSLQTCTTRVTVTLVVGTQLKLPGVGSFQVSDDIAITDQEAQWATLPCS